MKKTVAFIHFVEVDVSSETTDEELIEKAEEIADHMTDSGTYMPNVVHVLTEKSAGCFHSINFVNEKGERVTE